MSANPEPLRVLLESPALAAIRARLEIQGRLLQAVRQGLPEFLAGHCRHCVGRDDSLLIYVDSAAWGSQVRFYGPGLLARLEQSAGRRFSDIRIRSLLPVAPPEASRRRFAPPAGSASENLRESVDNAASEEIREALLRLSRTLEKLRDSQ